MNPILKRTAAVAAVLAIAVIGYNLLPSQPSVGGPGPTSSPSATPVPSATPAATSTPIATDPRAIHEGELTAGRYRFQPLGGIPSLSVVADIPSGWSGFDGGWALIGPGTDERADAIAVVFLRADGLYGDPCHWDLDGTGKEGQQGDVVVGPAAIDLVNALKDNTSYASSAATPVSFGAFLGYELEIQMPSDLAFETCDKEPGADEGHFYVFSGADAGMYAHGAGERWHLYIVDVGGTRVVVVRLDYAGTPQASRDAANAIIESLEFTP